MAALQAWQRIAREDTKHMLKSVDGRFQEVINC